MSQPIVIDGSHGEGGGQILRTSLTLAAVTGRPLRLERIRAGRPKPGLAAQHLTSVRAAAAVCGAELCGDELGSQSLSFAPAHPPQPGEYVFDVAAARQGGSAGATSLVLQTVMLPLALADGESTVRVRGGTHVAWSPSFDYLREVWTATLAEMGVAAQLELMRWGWYPAGGGEIRARIQGRGRPLDPLRLDEPGEVTAVTGRAVASNLPAHIPQRMASRAGALLLEAGLAARIEPLRTRAACPGAGLFLTAERARSRAGFATLGKLGKASETVAEEAVAALLAHRETGATLDEHLADQLIVPAALADSTSSFTVERVSRHLTTNAWTVEQFGLAEVEIVEGGSGTGSVTVRPWG